MGKIISSLRASEPRDRKKQKTDEGTQPKAKELRLPFSRPSEICKMTASVSRLLC